MLPFIGLNLQIISYKEINCILYASFLMIILFSQRLHDMYNIVHVAMADEYLECSGHFHVSLDMG